ncbi:hypothetical protein [Nonomuraea sp. NEAU-A123]|nr:hypothetical protein [Nonomuraea sp. NEAU-A123]
MGEDKDDKDDKPAPKHAGEQKKDVPFTAKQPTGPEKNGKGGGRH